MFLIVCVVSHEASGSCLRSGNVWFGWDRDMMDTRRGRRERLSILVMWLGTSTCTGL